MLKTILGLFRKKEKPLEKAGRADGESGYAPGTKITYNEALVKELIGEHEVLVFLYKTILLEYEQDNRARLNELLLEFKSSLAQHLLKENTRLYVYLRNYYKDDSMNSELINSLHAEMSGIGRSVFRFIDDITKGKSPMDATFKEDWGRIGEILLKRIEVEETVLYQAYQPPA
jgi:hypothetical protein